MRASEEWQRAGAYSVRIQGMNRQYHISLRDEFDQHDGDGTRYIVLLEQEYPIATCRFYENPDGSVTIGRVVVLPEYRQRGLGRLVIAEAEQWIAQLGYLDLVVESRVEALAFYQKLGFRVENPSIIQSGVFDCIRMTKRIPKSENT